MAQCANILTALLSMVFFTDSKFINETVPSRQSGILYLTSERRLALPPSTIMILTPTLSLPMGRGLPTYYGVSMAISIPFEVSFDDLGLTSEENTFGNVYENEVPTKGDLAGGDREVMYKVVEDSLGSLGVDGKSCLLRAICEMFELPLPNHGFIGEVIELFFSPSRTPKGKSRLNEYKEAEKRGKNVQDCYAYHEACPFSFFTPPTGNYSTKFNVN